MFFDVTNLTQVARNMALAGQRERQRRTDFKLDRWFTTENQRRDSGGNGCAAETLTSWPCAHPRACSARRAWRHAVGPGRGQKPMEETGLP